MCETPSVATCTLEGHNALETITGSPSLPNPALTSLIVRRKGGGLACHRISL